MTTAKKKIIAVLAIILIASSMSTAVYADDRIGTPDGSGAQTLVQENGDGYSSITIYDGVTEVTAPQYTGEVTSDLSKVGKAQAPRHYPFEISNVDERGTWLVVKSFEVSADVDPQAELVETDLIRDGKRYAARDILRKETPGSTDSREASKSVTITSASKDRAKILEQLDKTTYYSEGGYEGHLTLDEGSIKSEVSGTSTYSYPVTEKVELTGLDRSDPSLIEKSITKNGATLSLSDVDWVSMGSTVSGDQIVSRYKAVATYTGTAYGSKADGYIVTANYKGTVTKEVAGDYIYSIIYAPVEEEPSQEDGALAEGNTASVSGKEEGTGGNTGKGGSVVLGDEGPGFAEKFKEFGIGPIRGWGMIGIFGLVGVLGAGIYFLVQHLRQLPPREPREEPVREPKPPKPPKSRPAPPEPAPVLDDSPGIWGNEDTGGYEAGLDEEVTVGDDMKFYAPAEDVLNIPVDDDPELSAMFERQEEVDGREQE